MYKTYVMHYTRLENRLPFIEKQLANKGISNYEMITSLDKEDIDDVILNKYYNDDKDYHKMVAKISIRNGVKYSYSRLNSGDISLCAKHITAFKKALKQEEEYCLFLEDDCKFYHTSITIEDIISSAPTGWDVIVLGGKFPHAICNYIDQVKINGITFLKAAHPSTNTTSSILYKKKTISKIFPYAKPFAMTIDWQLNYAFNEAKLNVYHLLPYICGQDDFGSVLQAEREKI